jgi:hypothetical protein
VSYEEASRLIKQVIKSGNVELANQLIAYYEKKKIIPKVKLVQNPVVPFRHRPGSSSHRALSASNKGKLIPFVGNPPPHIIGKIYQRILEVRASKAGMPHHCDAACKAANHRYKHPFKENACVYALSDGSFLVK